MDEIQEYIGHGSAPAVWLAPRLVMLTAVGDSAGGIISNDAEKSVTPTKGGGTLRGTIYGISG